MLLSNKEIKEIIDSKLILDSLDVSLKQQSENSPRIYRGPGSIYQDKDGILRLKMYHSYQESEEMIGEVAGTLGGKGLSPGKIIGDHNYFSLEAKDMSGRVWREDDVWVSGNLSFTTSGKVVEANLRQITTVSERHSQEAKSKSNFSGIILGNYRLPFNEVEKTERKSSLSICRLAILGGSCVLMKRDRYLEVSADIPSGRKAEEFSKLLLEALSVGIGRYIYPLVRVISNGDDRVTSIHSKKDGLSAEELLPPFPARNPHEAKSLNDFIGKYVRKITEPISPLFGYWFRMLGESSGELENRALILTTCIEGILKEYYPKVGLPDTDFLQQVADADKKLKSIDLGKRVKERIQSTLGNAKSASPKNALYELAKSGVIAEELVKLWVELRNKSAHADQLRRNDQELQEFLDQVHGCIELFYVLLLSHVEYSGEYFQYSKDSWPIGVRAGSANMAIKQSA